MRNNNQYKLSRVFRIFGAIAAIGLIGGITGASASDSATTKSQKDAPIVAKCKADLAARLKLQVKDINVVEVQATTWPDASLGMPEIGKVYAQVLTPGSRVILEASNSQYLYTTSNKAFRYGGPVSIWSDSMLYIKPVSNDPNLNGDLYQCSLLGTNSVKLMSEVTDYYPQGKGTVIAKRRTSRSGHDLLYVKAGKADEAKALYSAMDFSDTAFNDAQDEWAAFVKPMVGSPWTVVVAKVGEDREKAQKLSLPEGVRTGQIAWSGETLMILVPKDGMNVCLEISPKSSTPEWKAVGVHTFPRQNHYMMNKSEWLEVNQVTKDGKPSVEVVSVWFTGDRNVIAQINDFSMERQDLLICGSIFISGKKGSDPAACTVDISNGEVITSVIKGIQNIKPFQLPPLNKPTAAEKS